MKSLKAIAVLAAALLAAGCSAQSTPPAQSSAPPAAPAVAAAPNPSAGKAQYEMACVACHGPDAKGVKGLGKDLVASKFVDGLDVAQLSDFIKKGRPTSDPTNTTKIDMPPKGGNPGLTDAQVADIAAYLKSL